MTTATTQLDDVRNKQRESWNKFSSGWKKWDEPTNKLEIARSFAKAAAIAVRALERMHSTELLLEKGLR